MGKIRIAVVEDEEHCQKILKEYMKRYIKESRTDIELSFFSDGDEIAEKYTGGFDIILMDIQMEFMDGMTAAERIREHDKDVIIIFITNMIQYALRGYEVDAMDFIVKPVEYFSFSQKLKRAIDRIPEKEIKYIFVPVETGIRKIPLDEVYYIESLGHNLIFNMKSESLNSRGTMKELEKELNDYGFFRISKSFIVNMKYTCGMKEGCCMIGEDFIPISRQKKKEFMETLIKHINK